MQETQEMQVQPPGRNDTWRRKWQSTLVFLPGESHGQRSLADYSPWALKESDTTEQLTLFFFFLNFTKGKCQALFQGWRVFLMISPGHILFICVITPLSCENLKVQKCRFKDKICLPYRICSICGLKKPTCSVVRWWQAKNGPYVLSQLPMEKKNTMSFMSFREHRFF